MSPDHLDLLREELGVMARAAGHLSVSLERCAGLLGHEVSEVAEQERLEALTSRFARLSDIMIQRVMRLVDEMELLSGGTLLDRILLAEKRGWVNSADTLIRIRKLRNTIAHDYAEESIVALFAEVGQLSPELLEIVPKITSYAVALMERLQSRMDARGRT